MIFPETDKRRESPKCPEHDAWHGLGSTHRDLVSVSSNWGRLSNVGRLRDEPPQKHQRDTGNKGKSKKRSVKSVVLHQKPAHRIAQCRTNSEQCGERSGCQIYIPAATIERAIRKSSINQRSVHTRKEGHKCKYLSVPFTSLKVIYALQ